MADASIDTLAQVSSVGVADYFYVLQSTTDGWCTAAQIVAAALAVPNNHSLTLSVTVLANYGIVYIRKLALAADVKLSLGDNAKVRIL